MKQKILAVWPDRYLVEWMPPDGEGIRGGFIVWRSCEPSNDKRAVSQIAKIVKKWMGRVRGCAQ